jgi:hypothetical protein
MAINSSEDCQIFTLDLANDLKVSTVMPLAESDYKYIQNKKLLPLAYQNTKYAKKIKQELGDSANFDFAPFYETVDLVFIDGAHSYEYVDSDTKNAFRIIKSGSIIIWHDYNVWDGVTKALNKLANSKRLYNIEGTSLVVYFHNGKDEEIPNAI